MLHYLLQLVQIVASIAVENDKKMNSGELEDLFVPGWNLDGLVGFSVMISGFGGDSQ
jgi:hypothetical protein